MQILNSYKKVKGSLAKQLCANEEQCYKPIGSVQLESFDKEDCDNLTSIFSKADESIKCLRLYKNFKAVSYNGNVFGSSSSQTIKLSNVFAMFNGSLRLCQIQHFCEVTVSIENKDELETNLVALVSCYHRHPEQHYFSKPALIFCNFIESSSFIRVHDIQCNAATCIKKVKFSFGEESVLCAVPLQQ